MGSEPDFVNAAAHLPFRLFGATVRRMKSPLRLLAAALALSLAAAPRAAAEPRDRWSEREKPIRAELRALRSLSDVERARAMKSLAARIRALPAAETKLELADELASLVTEGDFGRDALQETTDTLAAALRETPTPDPQGYVATVFTELASLARYEHARVSIDDPRYAAAVARLEEADERRARAEFVLSDLQGKTWDLRKLRGKVVLVNFWATWCPPCRKEMPDLEALYERFKDRGFVVLAITDEDAGKVKAFLADKKIAYPILLDPGAKTQEPFAVHGIPKNFVFDRDGKLVAQSIDMRTRGQFLDMLASAGLK
jgi:peroxiredoxin